MGRPVKHDRATRNALLDAAEQLLADHGPEAVSVRAVAEAIDESTQAIYSVFGSKQALIEGLAARGFGYLADLVEAVPFTKRADKDLVGVGHAFRTFAVGRPHLFRITFDRVSPALLNDAEASRELQRSLAALVARIERAKLSQPSLEVAFAFHSICHGLAANELSRLPPPVGAGFWGMTKRMNMEHVWTTTVGAFVHGLRK